MEVKNDLDKNYLTIFSSSCSNIIYELMADGVKFWHALDDLDIPCYNYNNVTFIFLNIYNFYVSNISYGPWEYILPKAWRIYKEYG